jgi:hypothetical protein
MAFLIKNLPASIWSLLLSIGEDRYKRYLRNPEAYWY